MSLRERYVRLPRNQRVLWVVGPLLILASIAVVIWYGLTTTVGKPWSNNLGYDVHDARSVTVTYQLTRPVDRTTSCIVVAKEMNHGTVGSVEDVIPPGPERELVRTVVVRTSAQAVMGEVTGCRAY